MEADPTWPMDTFSRWFRAIQPDDPLSRRHLVEVEESDEDASQTIASMGFKSGDMVVLEGSLLSEEQGKVKANAAQAKLSRAESNKLLEKYVPLKALWYALTAGKLHATTVVSIANDEGCGINRTDEVPGGFRCLLRHCFQWQKTVTVTPLILATFAGRLDAMHALIKSGAQVNNLPKDPYGFTPMHAAAHTRNMFAIELLIAEGANVATCAICQFPPAPYHVCDFIPLSTEGDKNSLLHVAASYGQASTINLLVAKGLGTHITNVYGATPLHVAAHQGNVGAIEALLTLGAKIDAVHQQGTTPLHIAIREGRLEAAKVLLSHGATINGLNGNRGSALHEAAINGSVACIQLLIDHGEEVDHRDAKQQINRTPLFAATNNRQTKAIDCLIAHGADIYATNSVGESPMHITARSYSGVSLKCLLGHGSSVNFPNADGNSLLHLWAQNNDSRMAQYLLARGADVNAVNKEGNTPLHAVGLYNNNVVKALIDNGADLDVRNDNGDTPLHCVANLGYADKHTYLLLSEGASPSAKNNQGRIPYQEVDNKRYPGYVPYTFQQANRDRVLKLLEPKPTTNE